ncbi:MAG: tetratricopeptide repeat protein [Alphaproteobacteria bacterium]|nr:tetratricopeptide repeat protein [Alphaproteobacteria bacterium]
MELAGADLRARQLAGLEFSGRDLRGATLADSDLSGARFVGADLRGADLSDCDLHGADFSRADLRGATLLRARGAKARFEAADLSEADLSAAVLPGIDLQGARLSEAVAIEARLEELDARGAKLDGLRAAGAALDLGRFDGASMNGVGLEAATLEGASLREASLRNARLKRTRLQRAALDRADLSGAVLERASMNGATVEQAILDGVSARGLRHRGVSWSALQLEDLAQGGMKVGPGPVARRALAALDWARGGGPLRLLLGVATAIGWPLRKALELGGGLRGLLQDARERIQEGRELRRQRAVEQTQAAAQRRADLVEAARQGVAARDGRAEPEVPASPGGREALAKGIQGLRARVGEAGRGLLQRARGVLGAQVNRSMLVPGADLMGVDLRRADLSGLDLRGARLRGAFLDGVDLSDANLSGAQLDGARLRGARLQRADLSDAIAIEADFSEARMDGARLVGLQAAGARCVGTVFSGAVFSRTALAAADLSGAVLADCELADTDLSGALLDQADLAGASLHDARVRGAELGGALGLPPATLEQLRRRGADAGVVGVGLLSLAELRASVLGLFRAALKGGGVLVEGADRGARGVGSTLARGARIGVNGAALGLSVSRRAASGFARELAQAAQEREEIRQTMALPARAPGAARAAGGAAGRFVGDILRGLALAGRDLSVGTWRALGATVRGGARGLLLLLRAAGRGLGRAFSLLGRGLRRVGSSVLGFLRDFFLGGWSTLRLAGRLLLGLVRAIAEGVTASARGLERLSTTLDGAALRYDERLDAAAERTEQLARSGAGELARLPTRLPELGRLMARGLRRAALLLRDGLARLAQLSSAALRLLGAAFAAARAEGLGAGRQLLDGLRALLRGAGDAASGAVDALERVAEGRGEEDAGELLDAVRAPAASDPVAQKALPVEITEKQPARMEPRAPSRLAGWVTLAAALLLAFYLGRQFLAGRTTPSEQVEELAALEVAEGELESALSRYEALLEETTRPSDRVLIRWQMAAALLDEGDQQQALTQLRLAVDEAGDEPDEVAEAWLRVAEVQADLGGFEEERAACEAALATEGVGSELAGRALVRILESHRRQGAVELGDARVQAWLAESVQDPGRALAVRAAMAERLVAWGDYDRALAVLEQVDEAALSRALAAKRLVALARVHEARGAQAVALTTYADLIARYPQQLGADGEALLGAAGVAHAQGQAELAASWLDQLEAQGASPRVEAQATLLRARMEREAGRPNTAALLYQRVLAGHPDDSETVAAAQLALAETLWAVDDPSSAEAMYEELLASEDAELVAQVQVGRARILQRRGELDAARDGFEEVIAQRPDSPAAQAARAGLAELELELGNYGEAIRAWREVQAAGRAGPEIDGAIADALLRAGRFDEAELAWTTLVDGAEPGSEAALMGQLGLARLAEARGDREAARAGYEALVAATPDPAMAGEALAALAGLYLDAGQDEEAMAAYRSYLRTLPEGHGAIFDTRLAMAEILRRRGEWERAEQQYQALLDEFTTPSRQAALRVALAELKESRGEPEAARQAWAALLEDDALPIAQRDDVVIGLVRATMAAGDPEASLDLAETWEERLLEESTRSVLTNLKAQALRALGRGEEADALSGGAEVDDDPLSIGLTEASELVNAGDWEAAVARYLALAELAEDEATEALLALRVADTQAGAGELEAARLSYREVLRAFGELSEARFGAEMGLAWVSRLDGEPEAAAERYAALKGPDPGSEVWRLEQLAEAWQEAGELEAAERTWKSLIQEHPTDPAAQAAGRTGLAELRRAEGDLPTARALFEQVARLAPDETQRAWARLNAAMLLVDEGRLDEAERALEELLESEDPEVQLQARIGLSSVLLERDSARRALRVLEDVDARALGSAWVASVVQQRASCLVLMGEPEAAERQWQQLAADYPDDPEIDAQARLALGDLAFGQDLFGEALTAYREVLASSRDRHYQARALLGLARSLEALGRPEEAREVYLELVEDYAEQDEYVRIAEIALEE